jgi:uncharacterized protein (TIGR03435 family)
MAFLLFAGPAVYGQNAPPPASAPASASAQAPASAPPPKSAQAKPAFDVASVKPAAPLNMAQMAADVRAGKMPRIGAHVDVSQAEYDYMSLKDLIALAYNVKPYQVSGPDWLGTQRFDIVAKLPEGASKDDAPAMLQALLADRFQLVVHRETQEHPVLALVVGKGGPKLKEAPAPAPLDENAPLKSGEMQMQTANGPARITRDPDGTTVMNMGAKGTMRMSMDAQNQALRLESSGVTMQGFADMLTNAMQMGGGGGRQVVDQTGLKGTYQVAVEIPLSDLMAMARAQGMAIPGGNGGASAQGNAGQAAAATDPGGSSVYESVQALGLKLDSTKAPVEQLIIDHAEKMPTEN